ncbi:hypothetical protein HDU78_005763 [Chytriomyces hyalinus]|nr:hypothetical protein HDU78_005763 [Chytriomyces hyalinus]
MRPQFKYNGSEKHKAAVRRYKGSEKQKAAVRRNNGSEKHKAAVRRYKGSEKHKAAVRRYKGSEKQKAAVRRNNGSEKHKAAVRQYNGSEKQKAAVRRYNGTPAFYAALRKHNRLRMSRIEASESIVDRLGDLKEHIWQVLGESTYLLNAKVAIHDTEYDDRGAGHEKEELIREFFVMDLHSKKTLNIRRRLGQNRIGVDPPNPAWRTAKQQLLDFDAKHNPDYYIAYEKPNHDRNRWATILGPVEYAKIAHKFVDFQKTFVNPITSLKGNADESMIYLPGRELTTLYEYLFLDSPLKQELEKELFSVIGFESHEKCHLHVHKLANLFLIWKAVLIEDGVGDGVVDE